MSDATPLAEFALEGRSLTKEFIVRAHGRAAHRQSRRRFKAVDDVSLQLSWHRIDAIVGESGSGKSTLARMMAILEQPTRGELWLGGERVRGKSATRLRPFRRQVQMIFQDPFASLNPAHTVGYHLARPLLIHGLAGGKTQARQEVERLLARVSLTPGDQFLDRYPHELSGGQRQRVAIARALAVRPRVLLADEPVSMLDVSIRMGVLNLLAELGDEGDMAILYITHDIASARYFANSVSVMYAGRLVEGGTAEDVTQEPAHPYTQVLIEAAPDPDRLRQGRRRAATAPAPPLRVAGSGTGCSFRPRCPKALPRCAEEAPRRVEVRPGHWAECWLYEGAPVASVPVQIGGRFESHPATNDVQPTDAHPLEAGQEQESERTQ